MFFEREKIYKIKNYKKIKIKFYFLGKIFHRIL